MREKLPMVSIVIPTYNSLSFIERCISTVLNTNYPNYEVIVVDDCSKDNTLKFIEDNYGSNKRLRIFRNARKMLAAGSRNKGFAHAKGEYVALLDHDVEVDPDWIKEMVKIIQEDDSIGIVQSKIHDINRRGLLQCVGVKIIPQMGWVVVLGHGKKDLGQFDRLDGLVGAATGVMYRRSVFRKVGGFDEELGINLDDLDLNWRVWVAGFKTVIASKAVTYHWAKKQKTRDLWIKRFNWEFHFSKLPRVMAKNYSVSNLMKYLPVYFFVSVARGLLNLLFRLNFAPLAGFVYGILWNFYELGDTYKRRVFIQKKLRKFDDSILMEKIFVQTSLLETFKRFWLPLTRNVDLSTRMIEVNK